MSRWRSTPSSLRPARGRRRASARVRVERLELDVAAWGGHRREPSGPAGLSVTRATLVGSARMEGVTVVDHVLLRRLVSILRDRGTPHGVFRPDARRRGDDPRLRGDARPAPRGLRGPDAARGRPRHPRLADEVVLVAILRAGLGLVDGFLRLVPDARVGHLGMYRDEEALRPVGYYENIPSGVADAEVFVVDPMLATGGSSAQAIARLKRAGAQRITFVCLVAAPGGRRGAARGASRGADPHRRARPRARRQRLHPPGAGRRRRPHLRNRPLTTSSGTAGSSTPTS